LIVEKCDYKDVPCHTGPSFFKPRLFLARSTALANLKTLLIYPTHNMSIILTNADVHTLVRACPHLRFIGLGNHDTPVSLGAWDAVVNCARFRYAWMHDSMRSAQHLWMMTSKCIYNPSDAS
jgi:hypothetical protein